MTPPINCLEHKGTGSIGLLGQTSHALRSLVVFEVNFCHLSEYETFECNAVVHRYNYRTYGSELREEVTYVVFGRASCYSPYKDFPYTSIETALLLQSAVTGEEYISISDTYYGLNVPRTFTEGGVAVFIVAGLGSICTCKK